MVRRLILALVLLLPLPLAAQSVDADKQVQIILKVLTYDRQFEAKAKSKLKVGIVYVASDPASVTAANDIGTTLDKYRDKTVKKVPISFEMIPFTTAADVEKLIKAKGVSVLYIAPVSAKNLDEITRISQANKITTTTGNRDYVQKGVAVGVGFDKNKPQIYINLPSSKSEGSEFDASLLQIADVTRK
jgi:ABC-type sugar transport system substrate-binding protein